MSNDEKQLEVEIQPVVQPIDEVQPVDAIQPVDEIQPVPAIQLEVEIQPVVQPIDEVQPVDAIQPVDEIQPVPAIQPEVGVQQVDEIQPVDEVQPVDATQPVDETTQPVDEMSDDSQELLDEISTPTETSNDAINLVDEISSASQEQKDWVVNIEALLNQFSNPIKPLQKSTDRNSEQMPSIFHRIFKPRMVYFGKYPSRDIRAWKFVGFLRANFGLNLSSYRKDIQEKKDLVLSYYQTDKKFRCSKDFLEYLLINSCFFVFAILSFQNIWNKIGEKRTDPRDQRYSREFKKLQKYIRDDPIFFKREMVSMECQIPWFVVEAVYEKHSGLSKLVGKPIDKLALSCFDDLYPRVHKSKVDGGTFPTDGFKHLLHIFHWTRSPEGKFQVERSLQPIKMMDGFYIPSATDLKISATVFKKHAGGSIDVSYRDRTFSGVMQLAPWHIFDHSIKIYKDLLAFEWVYGEICGVPITAYVACMVCLLQTEEDVKLLRATGIIPSTRDDEKDVLQGVKGFKELICEDVPMSNDLFDLSKKMMAHHKSRASRYYAEFKSKYCGNPFITITVVAGVCLFFLSFIQYVIQAVFSTLSYFQAQKTYFLAQKTYFLAQKTYNKLP